MYYHNRANAGKLLAEQLKKYASESAVVLCISQGSVAIGAQIAMTLHTGLLLHLIKNIYLPGEIEAIASVGSAGTFGYNKAFSPGELEELQAEFRQFIDQKRFETFHEFNVLLGKDGEIDKKFLRHRTVVLVSDGLANAISLDLASEFLKTVAIKRLVVATPIASIKAVDRMHLLADEIHCLDVTENFMEVNHYYEDNTLPSIEDAFKIMRTISLNWHQK